MAGVSEGTNTFFCLSPVEKGKARRFAVRRGELSGRWDVVFNDPSLWRGIATIYSKYPLREIVADSFSGGTPLTSNPEYWNGEIPWVSPKDFGEFEISDATDHLSEAGLQAASLHIADPGSILIVVRSGILKHTLPVAINTRAVAVNQDVKVFTLLPTCRPRFLAWYLNVFQDRILPLITKHSTTVQSINTSEFNDLVIPLPPPQTQDKLVAAMDVARAAKRAKQAEADALLAGLDGFLLATLGLTPPPKDERKVFAIRHAEVPARFDPHFHLPVLAQNTRMLADYGAEPLGSLVTFSDEIWKPEKHGKPTFRYIEISNVNPNTGEALTEEVAVIEAPSRARMLVRTHDIIVSLTRPHHGSIAQITPDLDCCIASTGFSVLRNINEARLSREYLWCVLRTKMCLSQMLQRASGGNYPAITEPELAKVLVPIPKMAVQEIIATEARRRRDEARRLRAEAETGWQAAKCWFEEQLIGGVQP